MRNMRRVYAPMLRFALANRLLTLGGAAMMFVITIFAAGGLGLEFLPHLEEGNFWIRATMPQAVSLEASDQTVNAIRKSSPTLSGSQNRDFTARSTG